MEKPGRVTIHAIEIDGKTTVTIEDEGVGMTTEEVSMLFRIDVNHTRIGRSKEKGTGLGLILCHEFITRNRGEIHVESAPGTGTKVIFTLPSGKLNPIQ
jgi:signal transduction histidine kinase